MALVRIVLALLPASGVVVFAHVGKLANVALPVDHMVRFSPERHLSSHTRCVLLLLTTGLCLVLTVGECGGWRHAALTIPVSNGEVLILTGRIMVQAYATSISLHGKIWVLRYR